MSLRVELTVESLSVIFESVSLIAIRYSIWSRLVELVNVPLKSSWISFSGFNASIINKRLRCRSSSLSRAKDRFPIKEEVKLRRRSALFSSTSANASIDLAKLSVTIASSSKIRRLFSVIWF